VSRGVCATVVGAQFGEHMWCQEWEYAKSGGSTRVSCGGVVGQESGASARWGSRNTSCGESARESVLGFPRFSGWGVLPKWLVKGLTLARKPLPRRRECPKGAAHWNGAWPLFGKHKEYRKVVSEPSRECEKGKRFMRCDKGHGNASCSRYRTKVCNKGSHQPTPPPL